MKIKLTLILVLLGLTWPCVAQITALQSPAENMSNARVQQALDLRKQGDFNETIKLLTIELRAYPQDLQIKLELAASFYRAGHFSPGSDLFKQLLTNQDLPANIKSNVIHFISQYKAAIASTALLNKRLQALRQSNEPVLVKITTLRVMLQTSPDSLATKRYLIALYLRDNRLTAAKQMLDNIDVKSLSPQQAAQINELTVRLQKTVAASSQLSGKGEFILGHDDNITGSSYNDFYDDDESFSNNETGGIYTQLSGALMYKYAAPNIESGRVLNTTESGLQVNYFQRAFEDDIAKNRDYQIIELAAYMGKLQADNSRIRLPVSIKNIKLNGDSYARFFDGKLLYSWDVDDTRVTLSQKLGYRDYARYNSERENSTLLLTRFALSHTINDRLGFNGSISYELLDTLNEPFRSHDRYTLSGATTYRPSNSLMFSAGIKYQATNYKGVNDQLFFNDCEDAEDCEQLIYDFKRQDDNTSWFLQGNYSLNKHWGLKGRVSRSDRDSNQFRYQYQRNTVSVGLAVKF